MPYAGALGKDGFWDMYASSSHNPLLHFLELLWTKITYKHGISTNLFDDDFEIKELFRYLAAKPKSVDGNNGWEFRYVDLPNNLDTSPFFFEWEPHKISKEEFILLTLLCEDDSINTDDDFFKDLIQKSNINEATFLEELNNKKLVYKDDENNLRLLTDECLVGTKNGDFYAGENRDGKMMKWLVKND